MAAKMREAWEHAYFDEFVRPHLSDQIQYLGEVPHEKKLELLAGATALLNPIRWNEPFGLVMIEALACGTPVLAFAEGAAPEIVEDGVTGFLCADVAAMAADIGRAGQLDRGKCRAAVENYFSTERMVNEHLDLFREDGRLGTVIAGTYLDHLAVAAETWDDLWPRYRTDLGGGWVSGGPTYGFASAQVRYANGMKIEALMPFEWERNDFLRRFLDHRGPGPHHMTYKVPDIEVAIDGRGNGGLPTRRRRLVRSRLEGSLPAPEGRAGRRRFSSPRPPTSGTRRRLRASRRRARPRRRRSTTSAMASPVLTTGFACSVTSSTAMRSAAVATR